jgi:hypothetical protein
MLQFRLARVSWFLSAAILSTSAAQAMEIQQFDKMAQDDRAEYVGLLIQGAEKILEANGNADQAGKVESLFRTNAPDGNISIGMSQFMMDVAKARLADAQRALKDPSAHRLHVEDAMLVTLKKNTVPLSQGFISDFRAINSSFRPKYPLSPGRTLPSTPSQTNPPVASRPAPPDDDPIGPGGFIKPPKR